MHILHSLFSFRGRMGRPEYALVLCAGLLLLIGGIFVIAATAVTFLLPALGTAAVVLWVVLIGWIVFAAHFKRYHDIGGRESLIARLAFAPFIGLLVLLFIPGTAEANRHGSRRGFFAPPR